MVRIYALYCADRRILWFFGATTMVVAGVSGVCMHTLLDDLVPHPLIMQYVLAGQDKVHYPVQSGCHVGISRQTCVLLSQSLMIS
jgi:hypothetical protein